MAELGQLGDQGAQGGRADAGHADQEIGIGLPGRAVSDRTVDVAFEFAEFGLQQGEMPLDRSDDPALAGHAASMAFGNDHLDDPGLRRGRLCRRRATSSPRACASASAIGRAGGRTASAK